MTAEEREQLINAYVGFVPLLGPKRHAWSEGFWYAVAALYGEKAADRFMDIAWERERGDPQAGRKVANDGQKGRPE